MKSEKYFLLVDNFRFNLEMKTGGVFETQIKIKEDNKIKYIDDVDATWIKLLKNDTPFSKATYWLTAKDLDNLGISLKDSHVVPVNKDTKESLKKYAQNTLLLRVNNCFD